MAQAYRNNNLEIKLENQRAEQKRDGFNSQKTSGKPTNSEISDFRRESNVQSPDFSSLGAMVNNPSQIYSNIGSGFYTAKEINKSNIYDDGQQPMILNLNQKQQKIQQKNLKIQQQQKQTQQKPSAVNDIELQSMNSDRSINVTNFNNATINLNFDANTPSNKPNLDDDGDSEIIMAGLQRYPVVNDDLQNSLNFSKYLPRGPSPEIYNDSFNKSQNSSAMIKSVKTINYDGSYGLNKKSRNPMNQRGNHTASNVNNQLMEMYHQKSSQGQSGNLYPGQQMVKIESQNPSSIGEPTPSLDAYDINKLLEVNKQLMLQQKLLMENQKLQEQIKRDAEKAVVEKMQKATEIYQQDSEPSELEKYQNQNIEIKKKQHQQKMHDVYKQNEDNVRDSALSHANPKNRKKTIKRIKKKSVTSYTQLPDSGKKQIISTQIHYEISTIKYNEHGVKILETHQRLDEQPRAIKDMTNSKKILEQIKKHGPMNKFENKSQGSKMVSNMNSRLVNLQVDQESRNSLDMTQTQQSNISKLSKASGAGFLSNIVNPKNFTSMQTIQKGPDSHNVYIQTGNPSSTKRSRKRITIIEKKRNADGSYSSSRQNIYKDFGDQYAAMESKRLNSACDFYKGSAKNLEKLRRENQSQIIHLPDGSIEMNITNQKLQPVVGSHKRPITAMIQSNNAPLDKISEQSQFLKGERINARKGRSIDDYSDINNKKSDKHSRKSSQNSSDKRSKLAENTANNSIEESKSVQNIFNNDENNLKKRSKLNDTKDSQKLNKSEPSIESNEHNKTGGINVWTPRSLQKNLNFLRLGKKERVIEVQFINQLIFDNDYNKRKDAIMNPIPPGVGQQKFVITRNKSGMNKLTPSYYLYLEIPTGKRILVLYAKKMPFMKQSYYLISLQKNRNRKENSIKETDNCCLGKLRALDGDLDKFVLYDNGENYQKKKGIQFKDLRKEHGSFIYRYEPCNVGNIRKMIILYPAINCIPYNRDRVDDASDSKSVGSVDRAELQKLPQYREIPPNNKFLYSYVDWRPTSDKETMISQFELQHGKQQQNKYKVFVDNPPQWNPKTNTYVYDFKGRVTEPSIKNFQLIPESDEQIETLTEFVLQFGKRDKDEFILDIQFPLSIYQGFGLALSAFDTD